MDDPAYKRLKRALEAANIDKDKIENIIDPVNGWGMINDKDMDELMQQSGDKEKNVIDNFEEDEMAAGDGGLTEDECKRLFRAWKLQNGGGKLKRRRRRNSKRKKSKKGKSNRRRKRKTRRRSKKRS